MAASAEVTQAAYVASAGPLAVQLGIHVRRALTRFSRQLRHKRVNARRLTAPGPRVLPREPRWLATDLANPLVEIVALDDRRLTIEAQFRDTKGCRFEVRLEWPPCPTPSIGRACCW